MSPRVISLFEKGVEDQLPNDTRIYRYNCAFLCNCLNMSIFIVDG